MHSKGKFSLFVIVLIDDDDADAASWILQMCIEVDDSEKKQAAVGLPSGWTFIFSEDTPYGNAKKSYIPGLYVYHPNGNKILRSAESVVAFVPKFLEVNPNAVHDFNCHIGVIKEITSTPGKNPRVARYSPLMTSEDSCGECTNCMKDACGRCASCVSNRGQVCIQKVSRRLLGNDKCTMMNSY